MKRVAAVLATLAVVTTAAGCKDDRQSDSTVEPTSPAAETTDAPPATDTAAPEVETPLSVDELLALGRPIVLAHTAGEDEYPASTLYGFGESVKAGVDMLDLNVQLSGDGVLVVHHDDTVDRATGGTGAVGEMTYDELSALDDAYWFTVDCVCTDQPDDAYLYRGIRTGDRPAPEGYEPDDFAIPTFRQVAERFPGLPLNVEIKGEGEPAKAAADVLAAELADLGRNDSTVVASFDDEIVAYFHGIAPDVEVSPGLDVLTAWVLERTPIPDGMRILQLPPEFSGLKVISGGLVADSKKAGYPIWVWPNDRDLEHQGAYFDFLAQGIEGLNINFPAQGVAAVQQFTAAGAVPARPSAGCAAAPAAAPGETTLPFTAAGLDGTYVRHVPPAHDGTAPLPLVLDLHGWSEPAAVHVVYSGLAAYGDDLRFVTLVPDITRPVPRWDAVTVGADIDWVAALIDEAEATLCIDTARVYVTGMSNGAMMTSALACALSDRIAAVAPVAGVRDPVRCDTSRAVPLVTFHGTDDQFLAYDGGLGPAVADLPNADNTGTLGTDVVELQGDSPSVPEMVSAWAARNGCGATIPEGEAIASDVTLLAFDCPAEGETVLYRIDGGGHTWPGSEFSAMVADRVGSTTTSISANEVLVRFFLSHPLA